MRLDNARTKRIVEVLVASRNKKILLLSLTIIVLLSGFKFYNSYELASSFNNYVSDEVWYVSSSRNIMNDIFHHPTDYIYENHTAYTIFFSDKTARAECLEDLMYMKNIIILKGSYEKTMALAIAVPPETNVSNLCRNTIKIIPGYPMPDKKNVYKYYNLEHPPLGKYIIGLSMALMKDEPVVWRLPGIIEASIMVLILGFVGWRLLGFTGAFLAGLAASLDPLTTNMAAVGMLDIHLAFFTSLAVLGLVFNRKSLVIISILLSGMVKYSGFFLIPFAYVLLRKKGYTPRSALMYLLIAGAFIVLFINLPLINYFGLQDFVSEFIGALKWHTTSRPPGPTTSNPIEWVMGWNPFMLHINPDVPAKVNSIFYAPGFVMAIVTFFLFLKKNKRRLFEDVTLALSFMLASFYFGYFLTMVLGNRTLYSFYMTQASPIFYALFPASLAVLTGYSKLIDEGFLEIKTFIRRILRGKLGAYQWPSELDFINRLMNMTRREKLLFTVFLIVSLFSFFLHIGYSYGNGLYSDAQWISSGKIFSDDPGRLMGFQGLIIYTGLRAGFSVNLFLFLDMVFLILVANEILIYRGKTSPGKYVFLTGALLSLIAYGTYDGTAMSLFFFILSLNLLREGKDFLSGLTMGLAAGNPLVLIAGLLSLPKKSRVLLSFLMGFIISTIPIILFTGASDWFYSFISFFTSAKNLSLFLFLGSYSWITLAFLTLSLVIVYSYVNKHSFVLEEKLIIFLLIVFLLMPGAPPQWLLFFLLFNGALGLGGVIEQYLVDFFNAGILLVWFLNNALCMNICKYTPTGPLDPWGFTALFGYIRDILLVIILLRILMVHRDERLRH